VQDFRDVVTSTDSFTVRVRTGLSLPVTTASKVSYVTDSKTCQSALAAINTFYNTPSRSRALYVYKIGTYYGVEDPIGETGETYRSIVIFDSKWVQKSAYAPN